MNVDDPLTPRWLRPLVDNVHRMSSAYLQGLPADVRAMMTAASAHAGRTGRERDAAVLVLFSAPLDSTLDAVDLLVTVRSSSLRNHAGQAAFPGGVVDPDDDGPVATALREANEETGIDPLRVRPLVTLDKLFIAPTGFQVVPVLAYSEDPGPVSVVDPAETASVARVPVRAFINPANRLMVYRDARSRRWAMPAFRLNEMLVWGFTAQVVSAMLDVAGWTRPWDTTEVLGLDEAMRQVGGEGEI